ncbi:DUF5682 family protein [Breznakiella homolactica]|uniref:Uncharacterized protein n=1 Tax=Breznakiella homolactica TaxID=2798577 RepID=A0A7T7XP58_9SPIR|nr:DUF5682 family protein [Breznakiella homolactica]QQO09959.1 DUF5682 family protein [Breznakiella homolactica]
MAAAVQSMQGPGVTGPASGEIPPAEQPWRTPEGVHLFGIRHLSAAGAWHVRRFLDEIRPDLVLIESPSDTSVLIEDLTRRGVQPPVAVLCYTADVPVHSIVYPLASYSPEYQALLWAKEHKKKSRFIDLPSDVKTPLYRLQEEIRVKQFSRQQELEAQEDSESNGETDSTAPQPASGAEEEQVRQRTEFYRYSNGLYEKIAELGGETDYDTYWERSFEHNTETGAYLRAVALHSAEMRAMTEAGEKDADPLAASINYLRESYMKRCITEAIAGGTPPDKIAVILGAYHVKGVMETEPMDDAELAALPRAETRMTLMPYSYYRLGSFSGYGAGNHAPFYYEMMYSAMEEGRLENLPEQYITELSRLYRAKQGYSSTASAIEAVRLAKSLQYIHGGTLPTLKDLHDSAVAAMAGGEVTGIAEAFASLDVGTRIGTLPEGVSQTPIQDDMNRMLKKLKLEKFKSAVAQDLKLDLRENLKVKNEEAAFLDLDRSVFLNRLAFLGIGFARKQGRRQDSATWAEDWILCWTPETEIQVVESVLYGDTVEAAASYVMKDRLEKSADVLEVAGLVRQTCECRLTGSILEAIKKLQALASETESFSGAARAGREMSFLVQYGSVRRFDTEAIVPILQQLFLKAALLLYGSASCSEDTAREIADDMAGLHYITQEHHGTVNDDIWLRQLAALAKADDRSPLLSGFAFSILMERGSVTEDELLTEVSRHLSAGNTPEAGALWFEGLSRRNRYVLLSRIMLWKQLDAYLAELEDDEFKRALVCLRRVFSGFEPHEKNGICEILAELWGVDAGSAAEFLREELTDQEEEALSDLNDFDFGDLE